MKLVIDCLIFEYGKAPGYQEYLFNLLDYFKINRNKFIVEKIILIIRENQKKYFLEYENIFNIHAFSIKNIIGQHFYQNLVEKLLKLDKQDIILYTYGYSSIWRKCKKILVIHDLQYIHYPRYFSLARRIQRNIFVPLSIYTADVIVAISNETKKDIINNFKNIKSPIKVIYNYCNFKKFNVKNENNNYIKLKNIINNKYFLSVSSLAPHKNIIILIKAFLNIVKNYSNIRLVLVGSKKNLPSYIKKLIDDSIYGDRIIFTDYIDNYSVGMLYRNSLAFILPTLFEGFGMPIAEALYFNIITILSDINICHEIAEDKAYYFNPTDINKLEEYLNLVIINKIKPIDGESNLILQKLSEKNTTEKYIEIINELAKN